MTDISHLFKRASRIVNDNSQAILTATAASGVVVTSYLVARAAFNVGKDVNAGHYEPLMEGKEPEFYDAQALVRTYWPQFIPALVSGTITIAAILGAHRVSTRRNATLLAALSLSERAFDEYRGKVLDQIGKNKEQKVRDAVAQDRVDSNPVSGTQVLITNTGEALFNDLYTDRYFKSSVETVRRVQNDINARIMTEGNASVNDFYEALGLPRLRHGDDIGWNLSNLLNVEFSAVISEDGQPCIAVDFLKQPTPQYWKYS